jgi:hypothetical protein
MAMPPASSPRANDGTFAITSPADRLERGDAELACERLASPMLARL